MTEKRHPQKLIEYWFPLGLLWRAAPQRRVKGEPAGVHQWWGTRPAALARAIAFAQLVDAPDDDDYAWWHQIEDAMTGVVEDEPMLRPFIDDLIRKSNPEGLPPFHDPFCGTGGFAFEAMRLGLRASASDLNPVAALIGKTVLMKDRRAVAEAALKADKIAERCRDEVAKLYGGADAFIWMHTVPDPNPAFSGVDVPLSVSFALSGAKGREVHLAPVIGDGGWRFELRDGEVPKEWANGTRISPGTFKSILSETVITRDYIREQAEAGRLKRRMVAAVRIDAKGKKRYELPTAEDVALADAATSDLTIKTEYPNYAHWFTPVLYGGKTFDSLHLPRQKKALEIIARTIADEAKNDGDGGRSVAMVRALALSELASWMTTSNSWYASGEHARNLYVHQCIPMAWDFCEYNPFGRHTKAWKAMLKNVCGAISSLGDGGDGNVSCQDAMAWRADEKCLIATEMPYYDLVATADLSDFFYFWQRQALKDVLPGLYVGCETPKEEELTALAYRRGGREAADGHYRDALKRAIMNMAAQARDDYPMVLLHAFKSSTLGGRDNVPFVAFVEAIVEAGLQITATWPLRDKRNVSAFGKKNEELFSALIFVCRKCEGGRGRTTRRAFLQELRGNLPGEMHRLRQLLAVSGPEFANAAVGVGLRIYTAYSEVLAIDGSRLGAGDAVKEILKVIWEIAAEERAKGGDGTETEDFRSKALAELKAGVAPDAVRAKVSAAYEKASAAGRMADAEALNEILNEWNKIIEEKDNEGMA